MYSRDAVEDAIWLGRRCYRMASHYNARFDIRATLYRAAAATRDAVTVGEVMSNLFEPLENSEPFITRATLQTIRSLAEARRLQADHYRNLDHAILPEECQEAVVDAFEAAAEVYAGLLPHLDDLPPDRLGSILDSESPAAYAIIAAFDAHNAAEEAFDQADYYPAMMAYRASYEAYDMAYLDMETYYTNAPETNPLLRDVEGLARVVLLLRARRQNAISAYGRAETSDGVVAQEAAVEALGRAADALDHAVANLRAARLLEDE